MATIDDRFVSGHEMERILSVVDPVRSRAKIGSRFRMASVNDFPSNVGLGASASGFAALALAATAAAGLDLDLKEVSLIARRGAGSAARAVTGGFRQWQMGVAGEDPYSVQLAGPGLERAVIT